MTVRKIYKIVRLGGLFLKLERLIIGTANKDYLEKRRDNL